MVEDIGQSNRVVSVEDGEVRLLSPAVSHEVAQLAKDRDWPELLSESQMKHSRSGTHLVAFRRTDDELVPQLIASALVHPIPNWRRERGPDEFTVWREPFFGGDAFEAVCGRGHLEEVLLQVAPEDGPALDLSVLPVLPTSTRDSDERLLYALQPLSPVAIDRFTISSRSPDKFLDLYETFTRGCQQLYDKGHAVCVGVTYRRPFIEILEALELFGGQVCHALVGKRGATKDEEPLYKVLVFTQNVADAGTRIPGQVTRATIRLLRRHQLDT